MKKRSILFLHLMLLFSLSSLKTNAASVSESFNSRTHFASSTALWNQALGKITPTMVLRNWNTGGPNQNTDVDFGDGSHGDFNSTTWSKFGTVDTGSKIIYLNTDSFETFKFTNFTLDSTWRIIPVGSRALKIKVLGNMTVSGNILCNGDGGTSSTGTAPTAVAGTGGSARCGGFRGGNGAGSYVSGTNTGEAGLSSTASVLVTGGQPGFITASTGGAGGGGGGAWTYFGAPGANSSDKGWDFPLGSGGGGGGSGSANEAGGGGGGGGGVIIIHVAGNMNISAGAVIEARGGNGGSSPSTGGEGGGGGGGSIQIWVGDTLSLEDGFNVPQINALAGLGGNASGGGNGGDGWRGRNWISAKNFPALAGATFAPVQEIDNEGTMEFITATAQTVITKGIDTLSTVPTFTNAAFSPASADVSVEVAGSRDSFQSDDSGWVSIGNIAQVSNKRFLRFKITINNSNAATPSVVDSVSADYNPGTVRDYDMQSSGCGLVADVSNDPPPPSNYLMFLFLTLPFLLAGFLLRRLEHQT